MVSLAEHYITRTLHSHMRSRGSDGVVRDIYNVSCRSYLDESQVQHQ